MIIHAYIMIASAILAILTNVALKRGLYTREWEKNMMEYAANIFTAMAVAWGVGLAIFLLTS